MYNHRLNLNNRAFTLESMEQEAQYLINHTLDYHLDSSQIERHLRHMHESTAFSALRNFQTILQAYFKNIQKTETIQILNDQNLNCLGDILKVNTINDMKKLREIYCQIPNNP